jgi:hypothetical protein
MTTESVSKLQKKIRNAEDRVRVLLNELDDRRRGWQQYLWLIQDILGLDRSVPPLEFLKRLLIWECASGCVDAHGHALRFVTHTDDPIQTPYGEPMRLCCPWCGCRSNMLMVLITRELPEGEAKDDKPGE